MDLIIFTLAVLDGLAYASQVFMVAVGMTLIFGVMRILNIAHGGFYAIGAYLSAGIGLAIASAGLSPWLHLPALVIGAAMAGGVLGLVIERFVLRYIYVKEEVLQLLVTFAIFMILEDVQRLVFGVQPYAASSLVDAMGTINVLGIPYNAYQVLLLPGVAVLTLVGLRWFLHHTLLGHLITATAEDREAATAMGVNANRVFLLTFTIGTVLAALGGAFAAPTTAVQLGMGADMIVLSFAVVVTAGLGQVEGAAVTAVLIGLGRSFAIYLMPELDVLMPYFIMMLVLLVRPNGLFGTVQTRKI
ncbi:High-affinity branched-chain amino acid transport system permease protein LivH [wastewater metagenome]|uniref:High-affinity branched-chain amino acid transport system permease protein LivH n=3 Tax=root TaxID=1 RepID=A0A5B8RGA1_9ZZZZ|nr:branched-chain amino acid ABC transporter permease [Arhodomonas aquaeolei]MCS4504791.1 branched-chain amino acid ABC transporter permease [Arhodomonas aquaeolei]QEA06888.1 high-affinity branched-chain amino acid transport system permease protein LivH [uncultured organism]